MPSDKLYRVYILQNAVAKFYIGLSEDVSHRLRQHNEGVSKWTSAHRPWRIIWSSEFMLLRDARKLEFRLKKQKGGHGFFEMTGLQRPSGSKSREAGS